MPTPARIIDISDDRNENWLRKVRQDREAADGVEPETDAPSEDEVAVAAIAQRSQAAHEGSPTVTLWRVVRGQAAVALQSQLTQAGAAQMAVDGVASFTEGEHLARGAFARAIERGDDALLLRVEAPVESILASHRYIKGMANEEVVVGTDGSLDLTTDMVASSSAPATGAVGAAAPPA